MMFLSALFVSLALVLSFVTTQGFMMTQQRPLMAYRRQSFPLKMAYMDPSKKAALIERLISAKTESGKSYDDLAKELGTTNAFVAQLFTNQAQLRSNQVEKLTKLVPKISPADLKTMQDVPMRSFDPMMMQEPFMYRLIEAMQHYGLGLKEIVNEKKGDGIISAIDLYVSLDLIKGKLGEDRFVLTLNGKFLPHIEQLEESNTALTGQK